MARPRGSARKPAQYDGAIVRRWFLPICVLLLFGAIANVAVAWGLTYGVTLDWESSGPVGDDPYITAWLDARSWESDLDGPYRPVWFVDQCGIGRRRMHLAAEVISGRILMPADIVLETAGWPMPALEGDSQPVWTGSAYIWIERGLARLPIADVSVPLRPMWPGFAINTLLFAAAIWLLFAAPFALRRRRRIRRGLCPKCAYDLRGRPTASEACPECGQRTHAKLRGA